MSDTKKEDTSVLILRLFSSKIILMLCAMIAVISVFFYYPTDVGDYDIWWHFALGKHYIENQTISVDHSIFSWTKADPKWIYNTWLGSTLMYVSYKLAGGFGLWVMQWLILIMLLLIAFRFMIIVRERFNINYLLHFFAVIVGLNLTAIYVKPELFTTLLFGVTVVIYLCGKANVNYRFYYMYPPLMILWCNLHGGFLSGLMFITLAFIAEFMFYLLKPEKAMSLKMLMIFGLTVPISYLATLVNPYGINYHLSIYNSLTNELYTKYSSMVFAYLSMWNFLIHKGADIPFRFINTAWVMISIMTLQVLIIIYQFIKNKFVDLALITLIIFFFFFGMSSARYTIFFIVLSLFSVPYLVSRGQVINTDALRLASSGLSFVIILTLSAFIVWINIFYATDKEYFGAAYNETKYLPYETSEFLLKSNINENIFNDYLIGGYLMWKTYPKYKVFIDPRYGPFWQEVGPDYFELINHFSIENFNRFNEKYKFKIAVLHMRETTMIFSLLQTGDWRLLYLDITSAVLIHKSLIPTLNAETLSSDVSPKRFRQVDNPDVLTRLFYFYIEAGPQYGAEILNIYKSNVRGTFKYRDMQIKAMETMILYKTRSIAK